MIASIALVAGVALAAPVQQLQLQDRANTQIVALVPRADDSKYLTEIPGLWTDEDIKEFFDPDEFILIWTEEQNLIALDRELHALQDALNDQVCLALLASLEDPTKPFLTSELSESERAAVLDQLRIIFPNVDSASDVAVRVSMRLQFSYDLDGHQRRWTNLNLPDDDEYKAQKKFMRENGPIEFTLHDESEERTPPTIAAYERGMTVVFRGVMGAYTAAVTKRAATELERVVAEARSETARLVDGLIEKMSGSLLDGFGGSLPSGQVRLESLPEHMRKGLARNFSEYWEVYGYESQEDMQLQLSTLEFVEINPSFSLRVMAENQRGDFHDTGLGFYVGG